MYCNNCGSEISKEINACTSCGTKVTQVQVSPSVQLVGTTPKAREKHITFLFVTSLVFMIFFAIRCISALSSLSEWGSIKNVSGLPDGIKAILSRLEISVIFSAIMTVLAFACVLVFFIIATNLKNQQNPPEKRIKLAKSLKIFSILVIALGVVYMASEIIIYVQTSEFLTRAAGEASLNQNAINQMKSSLNSSLVGSMLFNVTFIAFGIANVIKSYLFARNLKK